MNNTMLKFVTQASFSFMVMCTCIFLVTTNQGKRDQEVDTFAWSGLTSTLTAWLPAPQQPGEQQQKSSRQKRKGGEEDS